jgi:exopolyphosphatase/guanosine-5'-triphosphate,3'-diphosphate pyrophosphatase
LNTKDILQKIKKETSISFEVIDTKEEARLTLKAVQYRLDQLKYASKSFVLIDIGGGSTEIIFSYFKEVISKSFPVGIVTIAQTYKNLENIENTLEKEMSDMQIFCNEIYAKHKKPKHFVATAGTPTTVAAMKLGQTYSSYNAKKINGTNITKDELDLYLKKLLFMPFENRELTVGVGRSDLIAAGILIYKQLFDIVDFTSCIVIDDGLREGLALDGCDD